METDDTATVTGDRGARVSGVAGLVRADHRKDSRDQRSHRSVAGRCESPHKDARRPRADEPIAAPVRIRTRASESPPTRPAARVDATPKLPVSTGQMPASTSTVRESTPAEPRLDQADFDTYISGTTSAAGALKRPPIPATRSDVPTPTPAVATRLATSEAAIAPPATLTPTPAAVEASATNAAVGAPPSAQAEGKGTAEANAGSAQDAGKQSRRRGTRRTKAAIKTESPVSPRRDNVLAGNLFAPLSELAEEDHVPPPRRESEGRHSSTRRPSCCGR